MTDSSGLVALYDIWPGNGAGPFLQSRSPHEAHSVIFNASSDTTGNWRWWAQCRTVHVRRRHTPDEGLVSRSTCRPRGCRSTGSPAGISRGCCCCRCRSWPVRCEWLAPRCPRGYASPAKAAAASAYTGHNGTVSPSPDNGLVWFSSLLFNISSTNSLYHAIGVWNIWNVCTKYIT